LYNRIILSFKILEIEYRKATAGTKVTCKLCEKKFYPDKLRVHRKYFCGEFAQRTEAQSKTQKKKGAKEMSDDHDDEEEDDEVTKQKKLIKSMKEGKVATKKRSGSTPAKKKIIEDEDEEDEVDKQKRLIKSMKESKAPKKKTVKRRINSESDEYSDEEVDMENTVKKSSAVKKSPAKKSVSTPLKGAKRKAAVLSDEEAANKTTKVNESKKSKSPVSSKNSQTKRRKKDMSDEDPEVDSGEEIEAGSNDDSEVERDIAEALMESEREKKGSKPAQSILHRISWFRIILDEAHMIKVCILPYCFL